MFDKIFVEKDIFQNKYTQNILNKLKNSNVVEISSYQDHFAQKKKPYLHKRTNLNLYIAKKKGQLLKEAPDAYGLSGEPHYYYVHAYNCIYECDYCYLQGYFNSPDLVLFVNHDEIINKIENTIKEHQRTSDKGIWFHAGEFSDTLALSQITQELRDYYNLIKKYPNAYLELRTKSVNIKEIKKLAPLPNFITSLSLSSESQIKKHDLKTPPLRTRLQALKSLYDMGHAVAIHLDPVIYTDNFLKEYQELISDISKHVPLHELEYISIGVVRFTKDVYSQVKKNYPQTEFFHSELVKGHDGKMKYPRPMRRWILNHVYSLCINAGAKESSVYLCMED
jgi:spore photoproduct lyase